MTTVPKSLITAQPPEAPVEDPHAGRHWLWVQRPGLFYAGSILIHAAAVAALLGSWNAYTTPEATAVAAPVEPPPEQPAVVRVEVDIAPVRTCDMNIATLTSEAGVTAGASQP